MASKMSTKNTLVDDCKAATGRLAVADESATVGLHRVDSGRSRIQTRLSEALPGWQPIAAHSSPAKGEFTIGILTGEGIGSEVITGALEVLEAVACHSQFSFDICYGGLIGKTAVEAHGKALTPEVIEWCESVFANEGAILCGPGGGRFVYEMRARFQLFCKFTPIRPYPELRDTGVLRPEALSNIDLVVVRENVSGLYFGEYDRQVDASGIDRVTYTFGYRRDEIQRIIQAGINLARHRRRRLSLVVKPGGVPAVSQLWIEVFNQLVTDADITTDIIEVDNASYQIIAAASDFDVIVAPNLFGDILSDGAALLLGSRGMSYSGNFGENGIATYQTGHGAAHDISDKDIANPLGQILSTAMMLRESFGLFHAADAIETAIGKILAAGIRTVDIAAPDSQVVGTREMVRLVVAAVKQELRNPGNPG
jgi:3-isopropylmalate dehydrogenase